MREFNNVKALQFYGKSQYVAFQELANWLRLNQEMIILAVAVDINQEDKQTPHQVIAFYKQ